MSRRMFALLLLQISGLRVARNGLINAGQSFSRKKKEKYEKVVVAMSVMMVAMMVAMMMMMMMVVMMVAMMVMTMAMMLIMMVMMVAKMMTIKTFQYLKTNLHNFEGQPSVYIHLCNYTNTLQRSYDSYVDNPHCLSGIH